MKLRIAIGVILVLLLISAIGFFIVRTPNPNADLMTKEEIVASVQKDYADLYKKIKEFDSVTIGKPIVIASDIVGENESACVDVTIGNLQPSYYAKLHLWNGKLYGQFCEIDHEMKPFPDTDFFGYAESDYSVIDLKTGDIEKLEPEGWSFISSGVFCGSSLAYWGVQSLDTGESQVFINIFTLDSHTVMTKKELPTRLIATDFPGFFEYPVWSNDCQSATFKDGEQEHQLFVK